MKKYHLIIIAFFILQQSITAQQGWFWQNPLPQGNPLYGVSFTDSNNGTTVGSAGTILRTTDGGQNWVTQTSGITQWLYGVSFTDSNNGTAVGEGGTILRTTDGGQNWVSQTSGTIFACRSFLH